VIWVGREEEIFFKMGLDGKIKAQLICPSGRFRRVFKSWRRHRLSLSSDRTEAIAR
jgi:hypothetical protein